MVIDDFPTHRARVRTCVRPLPHASRVRARLNLPAAAAFMADIARARARGLAPVEGFRTQYAHAREAFSGSIARAREGFRTSTRAHTREKGGPVTLCRNRFVTSTRVHARPEFREQYARPRDGVEFLESIKRDRRDDSIVISLFLESMKKGGTAEVSGLSSRYFETHRARACVHVRENRRCAGSAFSADIARACEAGVFSVRKKGSRLRVGRRAGHA